MHIAVTYIAGSEKKVNSSVYKINVIIISNMFNY